MRGVDKGKVVVVVVAVVMAMVMMMMMMLVVTINRKPVERNPKAVLRSPSAFHTSRL